jgi:hypothetical protein
LENKKMKKKGIQDTNKAVKEILEGLESDINAEDKERTCFVSLNASKRLLIKGKTAAAIVSLLKQDNPQLVKVFGQDENRVPVYQGYDVIGEVRYNQYLDLPRGNNGCPGRHTGLAHFNGGYVKIYGTQWEGEYDHAEEITAEQAVQEIINSGNTELFDEDFPELQPLREKLSNKQ